MRNYWSCFNLWACWIMTKLSTNHDLSWTYFGSPRLGHKIKTNGIIFQIFYSEIMLNFDFLEMSLGLVSPPHFVYDFSRKIFLMLYSINWPNFIAWLLSLLEILGNRCIVIICFPFYDVMNFQMNLSFLIKPFFSVWPKNQDKNLNILGTKRKSEIKNMFHLFKALWLARKRLRPESGPSVFSG